LRDPDWGTSAAESLADDHDGVVFWPRIVENHGREEGTPSEQKIRGDDTHLRARVFIGDMPLAIGENCIPKRSQHRARERHPKEVVFTPQPIDATNRFLLEIEDLLRRFP